jgi:hypothetical protein
MAVAAARIAARVLRTACTANHSLLVVHPLPKRAVSIPSGRNNKAERLPSTACVIITVRRFERLVVSLDLSETVTMLEGLVVPDEEVLAACIGVMRARVIVPWPTCWRMLAEEDEPGLSLP